MTFIYSDRLQTDMIEQIQRPQSNLNYNSKSEPSLLTVMKQKREIVAIGQIKIWQTYSR